MEYLFGLYILALISVFFLGYKAVRSTINAKYKTIDRIASIQQWEYLRSLDRDGHNRQQ